MAAIKGNYIDSQPCVPCTVKRGLNASAKSIDLPQQALADLGQNFVLSVNLLCDKGPVYSQLTWLLDKPGFMDQ